MENEKFVETNTGLPEELKERLVSLAESHDLAGIRKIIVELPPADAASAIELFDPWLQLAVFRSLPKDEAAEIFTYVDSDLRIHLVESISRPDANEKLKDNFYELFNNLPMDDAVDLLDELPANLVVRGCYP